MEWRWLLAWGLALLTQAAAAGDDFSISSPAFQNGAAIPFKYSFHQGNVAPELRIANIPSKAKSLVLIVDDPDAPAGLWTHWTVWNIPVPVYALYAGKLPAGAIQGRNDFGHVGYDGPAPPNGRHRYFFRLFALDSTLELPAGSVRRALDTAMTGHVIGHAEWIGTFNQRLTVSD